MSSTNSKLTRVADNIRILSAAMVEKAKSGHPGGAMGGADFVTVLYTEFLRYDPDNMAYPYRDRFFLDPGHMSPMLYSVLSLAGYYTTEDLQSLRQWGSVTPGHPEVDVMRGVENTSGPLGQGHAMALGAAIAERFMAARFGEWMAHKTYAYISDGAVEEEISQGVGRIAGHLGLSNFIMYYDSNNIQLSTKVDEVDTENVAMKYEAWGWNVLSVDGHNINEIREALVLSRQNIKTLPALGTSRREEAAQVSKGGYVVMDSAKPEVVMVATGSEVATLVEGAELLAAEGISVRVVNVPSEGLFRDQPKSYQEGILPAGVVRYGLTSGLPVNLMGLVGEKGMIHGLDHFGWSAPYTVLDEKFGYNGATVAAEVKKLLGR